MLANEILEEAADACHVSQEQLQSGRRHRPVVRARQAAVYAMRHWTDRPQSFARLGVLYGQDHSTLVHQYNEAQAKRERDPHFRDLTDCLVEHARDFVKRRRITIQPGTAHRPGCPRREVTDADTLACYDLFKLAAEKTEADLNNIFKCRRLRGLEFEAICAAIWAIRRGSNPQLSYPQIGTLLNRDHTTVINADRRAKEMRDADIEFAALTNALLKEAERTLS